MFPYIRIGGRQIIRHSHLKPKTPAKKFKAHITGVLRKHSVPSPRIGPLKRNKMTPTPPYNPALQDGPAFRSAGRRRPQVRTPYDASHHTPPNPQIPITPLPDNGVDVEDVDDEDVGSEDEDVGEDIDGEEEVERENDVDADEEEEGGIEEGALRLQSTFPRNNYTRFC